MIHRLLSLTGYLVLTAMIAAYAGYAALVGYFNDWEFFFTPGNPGTKLTRVSVDVSPRIVREIDQSLWPQEARKYHSIDKLIIDGKDYDASIKARGWERHHWAGDLNSRRRSWRLRLRGKEEFKGMRTLNLRRAEFPTYMHGHLPYTLARHLKLFVPYTDIVEVFWNKRPYGVMTLWEQPGRKFLKNHDRPKGLIFSNRSTQGFHDLWTEPGEKGKEDIRWRTYPDTSPDETWEPLRKLLHTLQIKDDEEFLRDIRELIDIDEFIRTVAFWNLGGSFRQDTHNIRLYYNPEKKMFEWILWDIAGFHYTVNQFSYQMGQEEDFKLDWCLNLLMYRILKFPEFSEKRNQVLWGWMQKDLNRARLKEMIGEEFERIHDAVKSETNRLYAWRYFKNSRKRFLQWVDTRYDFITQELEKLSVRFENQPHAMDVTVEGQSGFELNVIKFETAIPQELNIVLDLNKNGVPDEADGMLKTRVEGNRILLENGLLLYPGRRDIPRPYPTPHMHETSLAPAPQTYRLFFDSDLAAGLTVDGILGVNSVTGSPVSG